MRQLTQQMIERLDQMRATIRGTSNCEETELQQPQNEKTELKSLENSENSCGNFVEQVVSDFELKDSACFLSEKVVKSKEIDFGQKASAFTVNRDISGETIEFDFSDEGSWPKLGEGIKVYQGVKKIIVKEGKYYETPKNGDEVDDGTELMKKVHGESKELLEFTTDEKLEIGGLDKAVMEMKKGEDTKDTISESDGKKITNPFRDDENRTFSGHKCKAQQRFRALELAENGYEEAMVDKPGGEAEQNEENDSFSPMDSLAGSKNISTSQSCSSAFVVQQGVKKLIMSDLPPKQLHHDGLSSNSLKLNKEMVDTLLMANSTTPNWVPRVACGLTKSQKEKSVAIDFDNVVNDCAAVGNDWVKFNERKSKNYSVDSVVINLDPTEKFRKNLLHVPFVLKQSNALVYVAGFHTKIKRIRKSLSAVQVAYEELRKRRMFSRLLEARLKIGSMKKVTTNCLGDAHVSKIDTLVDIVRVKGYDIRCFLQFSQEMTKSESIMRVSVIISENLVGKSGSAEMYKEILSKSNVEISVKRITREEINDERNEKEFLLEIGTIRHASYPNVSSIFGCCIENALHSVFISYSRDYIAYLLQELDNSPLAWETRLSMKKYLELLFEIAENKKAVENSPFFEKLMKKGYKVLYMVDEIDEYAFGQLKEIEGKKLVFVTKEVMEWKESEDKKKKKKEDFKVKFEGICSGIHGYFLRIAIMIRVKQMRETLHSTLLSQDISFFDSQTVGDLTSRLGSDCQQVSRAIENDLNWILCNVLQGTWALIYWLVLSWPLEMCTLVLGCILDAVRFVYRRYQKKTAKLIQEITNSLIRAVRVYGTEKQEFKIGALVQCFGWESLQKLIESNPKVHLEDKVVFQKGSIDKSAIPLAFMNKKQRSKRVNAGDGLSKGQSKHSG